VSSIRRSAVLAAAGLLLAAGCSSKSGSNTDGSSSLCPAMDDLISDFKQDNGVFPIDGRSGGWFTYADRSGFGTLSPPEGGNALPDLDTGNPNCSGPGSLHILSMGFTDWGSALGTDLVPKVTLDGGTAPGTYDASKYRGIAFWARAVAPIPFVQVAVLDPWTGYPSSLAAADQCMYTASDPTVNCSPYLVKFGYGYMGEAMTSVMADYPKFINVGIDTTWRRFEILWDDMKQDSTNPGRPSPGNKLNVDKITGIRIQVNTNHDTDPPTATNWELWLDDVSFVK
jgi:hypothetical protein